MAVADIGEGKEEEVEVEVGEGRDFIAYNPSSIRQRTARATFQRTVTSR